MIGILGGTFDPIHNGHVHIARQVHTRLELERVHFMPCAQPVHRARPLAGGTARCAMIELALAGTPEFTLNRMEIDRGGPSYMIDSLREIRAQGSNKLALVLGGDAFNGFAGWKQPDRILEFAHLVVCMRPGIELDQRLFAQRRTDSVAALAAAEAGLILELEVDAIDCSSSALRNALQHGETPRRWLHPAVADYIQKQQLYRRSGD